MIVAVTGASGFVGGVVTRALQARGAVVHAYGQRPASALRAPVANYRAWDVRTGPIAAARVDAVVHCAALVGDWGRESSYHAVNVDGTQAVIDSFPGARIVHVSSSSVYSDAVAGVIDERMPTGHCAHSAYARTKAQAEQLVLASGRGIVLRPHIVYGPGDTTLLPRLLAAAIGDTLVLPGDGRNRLSVTHVHNLTHAVHGALDRPHVHGVCNIADDRALPVAALLRVVLARTGHDLRLRFIPRAVAWAAATVLERVWQGREPPRGPRLTRYLVHQLTTEHVLDTRRARAWLGYHPVVDCHTGAL